MTSGAGTSQPPNYPTGPTPIDRTASLLVELRDKIVVLGRGRARNLEPVAYVVGGRAPHCLLHPLPVAVVDVRRRHAAGCVRNQAVLPVVSEPIAARGARGIRRCALVHVPVRVVAVIEAADLGDGMLVGGVAVGVRRRAGAGYCGDVADGVDRPSLYQTWTNFLRWLTRFEIGRWALTP
jgi:hypothetical protein